MIRVLHAVSGLGMNGITTMLMNLYRNIDRTKVQFDFLFMALPKPHLPEKDDFEDEAIALGARIYRYPVFIKHPFRDVAGLYRLLRSISDIDIIHIHKSSAEQPSLVLAAAILARKRVRILHSHNTQSLTPRMHNLLKLPVYIMATHHVACSTEAGYFMFGKRVRKKLIVLPNAFNLEPFRYNSAIRSDMRKSLSISDDTYVVINVGFLCDQKNPDFLVDAFACAAKNNPNMRLLLVGGGKLRDKIEKKVGALAILDKVLFLGIRDDVFAVMQAADIFCMPSRYEGLPMAAIEAQTAGLPCLISDAVSPEVKVTDHVELLPINKEPEIWAERILSFRVFDRKDTIEELQNAGYDILSSAKWLESFYTEAMAKRHRHSILK